jgi:hypothetical protein
MQGEGREFWLKSLCTNLWDCLWIAVWRIVHKPDEAQSAAPL